MKRIGPEQVAGVLRPDDQVIIGHGSGWPRSLVESLVTEATVPFRILHNRIDDELPYFASGAETRVRHVAFMAARHTRDRIAAGAAEFIPNSYGLTPGLLRSGAVDCDVVIVQVSPPDAAGWCSFGTCVAYLPAAVERARVVVAQVNPEMPRTASSSVHESEFDFLVELAEPLHAVAAPAGSAVTDAIAGHVAGLIQSGDVLQMGIGKLGDAVMASLADTANLRMWTETFNDHALDLLQDGVLVAGPRGEAPITATFVTGTTGLYDTLRTGAASGVRMLPVDHINHPAALAAQPRLVAINSALEVDVTGQINAESIGPAVYSGSGGHLDFAIGANLSPDGRYVCALPATARTGESRIVAHLRPGATVTVPRSLAGIVVTEFGVADLRGRTLTERAEALIAIAHPDHRAALVGSLSGKGPKGDPE